MKIAYVESDGISVTVHRCDLAARRPDPLAQLRRLEHLHLRAEAQQLAVRVTEMREGDDRAPFRVDPRLAGQPAPHVPVHPHGHPPAGPRLPQRAGPLPPEGGEL